MASATRRRAWSCVANRFRLDRIRPADVNFHPTAFSGDFQLPAGVVVAEPAPQRHPMGLQIAVRGIEVLAGEFERATFDVGTGDQVFQRRHRECLLHLPLTFVFKESLHLSRLPRTPAVKPSDTRRHSRSDGERPDAARIAEAEMEREVDRDRVPAAIGVSLVLVLDRGARGELRQIERAVCCGASSK